MDGKSLINAVLDLCDDRSAAAVLYHRRRIFECLDQACATFARAARNYKATAILPTIQDRQSYTLPPDFIDLYMERNGIRFVRYSADGQVSWPPVVPWDEIFLANSTTPQRTPSRVAIRDGESRNTGIAGTATATGARGSDGLAILTDSTKQFLTNHRVWPRDIIHNNTDGSTGVVVAVLGEASLAAALFDGSRDGWQTGDAYTIISSAVKGLVMEAPAAVSGHLITVPYIAMPDPVFSDHGVWRLPERTCRGIAAGAAALLQLSRHSYQETQWMNAHFAAEIRQTKAELARAHLALRQDRPGWI